MSQSAFDVIISRLEDYVAAGHRQNEQKILTELERLACDGLALKENLRAMAKDAKKRALFGAQSFLLYAGPTYLMRLNLWFPHSNKYEQVATERYERFLSIGICHNHNFDFFTVGLFGPGYTSRYFHSSEDLQYQVEGDRINFDRTWEVDVPVGKSMLVRRSEDFHIQYCPEKLSMTLNVIPHLSRDPKGRQFVLEEPTWRVQHVLLPSSEAMPPGLSIDGQPQAFGPIPDADAQLRDSTH